MPEPVKKFQWIITKDLLFDDKWIKPDKTGFGNVKSVAGLTYQFRLRDDDKELYYEGLCNGWEFDQDQVFAPLDWAVWYAGATTLEYFEGGAWKQL